MKEEIISKIKLALNEPIEKESQIVYILVETRKLLDLQNNYNYPELRFYCDWAVHIKKDKITLGIKNIMEKIYEEMQNRDAIRQVGGGIVSRKDSVHFLYMNSLKIELEKFLNEYNLPKKLLEFNNWNLFLDNFIKILVNQRICNPCVGIKYFEFLPSNKNSNKWKWIIEYKNNNGKYDIYEE